MNKNVCLNCKDRRLYCHSSCEKYFAYRKELEERNKVIRENRAKENAFNEYNIKSASKNKKRFGSKLGHKVKWV